MGKRIKILWVLILCQFISWSVCFADETDLFRLNVGPDALFILDLSGSMGLCDGCACGVSGCLNRLQIAKKAVFSILDNNGDGIINSQDDAGLGVRFGYMTFWNDPPDTAGDPFSGDIKLKKRLGTPYSEIWASLNAENFITGTPLNYALNEARVYLDYSKNHYWDYSQSKEIVDPAINCRPKYVIQLSDGEDSVTRCPDINGIYKLATILQSRKGTITMVKAVADAGYKVFVFGMAVEADGDLGYLMNWEAFYGGTNNPGAAKIPDLENTTPAVNPAAWCSSDTSNNPTTNSLSGYAFFSSDFAGLANNLRTALTAIKGTYSFSAASVAASRTTASNYLYSSSFKPMSNDSLWTGHLMKYTLNADGTLGNAAWDAGSLLQARAPSTRHIFSSPGGVFKEFDNSWGTWKDYLGVDATTAKAIIGYIRGESAYNPDNWKLGDILHSNPVTIGSPSANFTDARSPQAFIDFRNSNKTRNTIIVAGANDGQFHSFNASDGSEQWSFIPPNLLPKLRYFAHSNHPTTRTHQYLVDGPVTVADVWLGSGNGTSKSASDWHTLLVFGEGKGVRDSTGQTPNYEWSSSVYCDANFSQTYSSTYQYYCGYYAADVTNTSASTPTFKPFLKPNSTQAPYLGEPWSKMAIGRVLINGAEKWVGFIGAGYPTATGNTGRGFFVVDVSNGNILWSYTKADNASMTYGVPASPAVVDTDNDGFIDTAYVGDLGGNMWRFKFCTQAAGSGCNTTNWSGGLLFQAASARPIYTTATAARDSSSLWVFWGTGDKENPTSTSGQDTFFAVRDADRTAMYSIGNLQNISAYDGTSSGWYNPLAGAGEKNLSDPNVFGGIALFTTYTPGSAINSCLPSGTSKLYAMAMMSLTIDGIVYNAGAGVLSTGGVDGKGGARSVSLGTGLAQSPVVSQNPSPGQPTDVLISLSGDGVQDMSMTSVAKLGPSPADDHFKRTGISTEILHWRDGRLQ